MSHFTKQTAPWLELQGRTKPGYVCLWDLMVYCSPSLPAENWIGTAMPFFYLYLSVNTSLKMTHSRKISETKDPASFTEVFFHSYPSLLRWMVKGEDSKLKVWWGPYLYDRHYVTSKGTMFSISYYPQERAEEVFFLLWGKYLSTKRKISKFNSKFWSYSPFIYLSRLINHLQKHAS